MKIEKLDRIYSQFIRLRDSDKQGYGKCCSCGKIVFWKEADCGHFINRKHKSLRWDEKNTFLQCRSCNRFDEGNVVGYTKFIINKFGIDFLDTLEVKKHQTGKFTQFEIDTLTKHYREKVKELLKDKTFDK